MSEVGKTQLAIVGFEDGRRHQAKKNAGGILFNAVITTEACNSGQQEAKERADLCLGAMSFGGLGAEMPRMLFDICFLYVDVVSIKRLSFAEMYDLSLAVS